MSIFHRTAHRVAASVVALTATATVVGAVVLASPAHAIDKECDTAYLSGPTAASSSGVCGLVDDGRAEANIGITFQEADPSGFVSCDATVRVRYADGRTALQSSFDCLPDARSNSVFFRSTQGPVEPPCVPGDDVYVEGLVTGMHTGGAFQSTPAVYLDLC